MLYLNTKQLAFQFALVLIISYQGTTIVSVIIAARVPTPDTTKI